MQKEANITHPIRIRKSLAALQGTDQRKGYFYCLKLLGILPPPPLSDFTSWTYPTPAQNNYSPKCLHDVLISCHATSCQHGNIYFSYYHRHLAILTELFLNFAHQIIKDKDGLKKLKQIYPQSDEKYAQIYIQQDHWKKVFEAYQQLKGIPDQIASHYWNPTNYLNDSDLSIPYELKVKQKSDDPIDILFKSINKCYPWEVNVRRRWVNKESQLDLEDLLNNQNFFNDYEPTFSTNQQNFINGTLNPRNNLAQVSKVLGEEQNGRNGSIYDQVFYYVTHESSQNLKNSQSNFRLNNITSEQSLALYGAKSKNLHYISSVEKQKILSKTSNKQDRLKNQDSFKFYNNQLPHFTLAQPFFNKSLYDYLRGYGENCHAIMHNNFSSVLNHPSYSVMSLVFYPYHSWIDAQVQMKIRRSSDQQQLAIKNVLFQKQRPNNIGQKRAQISGYINNITPLSSWNISGNGVIKDSKYGFYPITQWVAYPNQGFSAAFCSGDYIMTKNKVRTSIDMNNLYYDDNYLKKNRSRYYFLDNFNVFNYNYNYQIGSNKEDINNILNSSATNIPKYLSDMEADVKIRPQQRQSQVNQLLKTGKQNEQNQSASLETVRQSSTQAAFVQREDLDSEDFQYSTISKKLFNENIKIYISHPSDIKNGFYNIRLKLRNVIVDLHDKLSKADLESLERYIDIGVNVKNFIIFGKSEMAETCHNCRDNKGLFFELDQDLRQVAPNIWKYLQLASINQVYFDSENPDEALKSLNNKIYLAPGDPKFVDYRLVGGAEEIIVDIEADIKRKGRKFIRLDAESYSVRTDALRTIPSKKHSTFKTSFDFFKLHDVDTNHQRNYFDQYVYKTLKGWISLGEERLKFSFDIPNFQRLLRLTLKISEQNGQLRVQVFDTDYEIKKKFYESFKDQ